MTNREFLNSVIAVLNPEENADLVAFANAEIAKLDARNDKRRNTQTKEQKENEERKSAIVELLGNGAKVASEIGSALGYSTQRVSALCKQLVDNGTLTVKDIKVKGKGTVKQYAIAE